MPNDRGTRIAALLVVLVLNTALPALGDGEDYRSVISQSFGSSQTILVVPAAAFTPGSANAFERDSADYMYFTAGNGGTRFASAPLQLPPGARMRIVCAFFYDTHPTQAAHMTVQAIRHLAPPDTAFTQVMLVSGGSGYVLECENVDITVTGKTDDDEDGNSEIWSWILRAGTDFADSSLRFGGAYIVWQRQVGPAPEAATFQDVAEDHPLFAYVEALQAAGISQPCDLANNFCPDNPVTRGQMAMWLAKALGLSPWSIY